MSRSVKRPNQRVVHSFLPVITLLICFCSFPVFSEHNNPTDKDGKTAGQKHVCDRECKYDADHHHHPMECEYEWEVSYFYSMLDGTGRPCGDCPFNQEDCANYGCITLNGTRRPLVTVNRQVPGPKIVVCKGDTIKVNVYNKLDDMTGITFHWHGIHQRGTPYMDGPSMITQCPITYGTNFAYKFKADVPGTYFWHSHMASNRADGLAGALIVRQPILEEPYGHLYDFDLTEHILIIQDWMNAIQNDRYLQYLYYTGKNKADFVLINGKGQGNVTNDQETAYTPREIIQVEHGKKYRIRLISNAFTGCHLKVSIDEHRLTAIAMDGFPIDPVKFDSLISSAGERFDFILDANQPPQRNYSLKVQGVGAEQCNELLESAIVQYTTPSPDVKAFPSPDVKTTPSPDEEIVLNPPVGLPDSSSTVLRMIDLNSTESYEPNEKPTKYYLHLGVNDVKEKSDTALRSKLPQINHITFAYPPLPLLTQHQELDGSKDSWFCKDTLEDCEEKQCSCAQVISANLNATIELFFYNADQNFAKGIACHPMHLHGYSYRVVGMGSLTEDYTLQQIIDKDSNGDFMRRPYSYSLVKDTACVAHGSYLIIQFVADNPGWWFLHCHVDFHAMAGMAMVIQVGKDDDVDIPDNFPKCGNFSPL